MTTVSEKIKALTDKIKDALGPYPRATTVVARAADPRTPNVAPVVPAMMIAVTYHQTEVVRISLDDEGNPIDVQLDSGGWESNTTKKRINDTLAALSIPFRVCHDKKTMIFCGFWEKDANGKYHNQSIPFVELMRIRLFKNGAIRSVVNVFGMPIGIVRPKTFRRAVDRMTIKEAS